MDHDEPANLSVDGKFGPATHNAVAGYQKSMGLDDDGVVGPKTWGALKGGR
ncbi:peptidoglycan-binding protein [Kocuria sp. JC486]|nr:peptidoglycan-binding protein [Kocuria sp. JC486]